MLKIKKEGKYQYLINKQESTGLKHITDSKAFIEYSKDIDDIYKYIEKYNPNKQSEILTIVDDLIAGMLSNKKINPIVTETFIRRRKLNISLVLITQFYFAAPKYIRLSSTHYFIMKIPNKRKLKQIGCNHLSYIDFEDFINLYKTCTAKPYFFNY